jgi:hypothetical protein
MHSNCWAKHYPAVFPASVPLRALYFRRPKIVCEVDIECCDDLLRRKVHGNQATDTSDTGNTLRDVENGASRRLTCRLAYQETFAFPCKEQGGHSQNQADADRGQTAELSYA